MFDRILLLLGAHLNDHFNEVELPFLFVDIFSNHFILFVQPEVRFCVQIFVSFAFIFLIIFSCSGTVKVLFLRFGPVASAFLLIYYRLFCVSVLIFLCISSILLTSFCLMDFFSHFFPIKNAFFRFEEKLLLSVLIALWKRKTKRGLFANISFDGAKSKMELSLLFSAHFFFFLWIENLQSNWVFRRVHYLNEEWRRLNTREEIRRGGKEIHNESKKLTQKERERSSEREPQERERDWDERENESEDNQPPTTFN